MDPPSDTSKQPEAETSLQLPGDDSQAHEPRNEVNKTEPEPSTPAAIQQDNLDTVKEMFKARTQPRAKTVIAKGVVKAGFLKKIKESPDKPTKRKYTIDDDDEYDEFVFAKHVKIQKSMDEEVHSGVDMDDKEQKDGDTKNEEKKDGIGPLRVLQMFSALNKLKSLS